MSKSLLAYQFFCPWSVLPTCLTKATEEHCKFKIRTLVPDLFQPRILLHLNKLDEGTAKLDLHKGKASVPKVVVPSHSFLPQVHILPAPQLLKYSCLQCLNKINPPAFLKRGYFYPGYTNDKSNHVAYCYMCWQQWRCEEPQCRDRVIFMLVSLTMCHVTLNLKVVFFS